jgi:hypothetical protein
MTSTTSAKPKFSTFNKQQAIFQTTVDMVSTDSTNAGAAWAAMPCYNVEWMDIEISVAVKSVTVTVTQDYAGGSIVLPTQSYVCAAGSTYHLYAIVPGTIPGNAVSKGSHVVTVTLTSTVGGDHGTCTGRIHLYGKKLI